MGMAAIGKVDVFGDVNTPSGFKEAAIPAKNLTSLYPGL
jgi:hypothetical protein